MARLTLNYREVALRNIEKFDLLGAFLGADSCRYHYPELGAGVGCAIGIMDVEDILTADPYDYKDTLDSERITRVSDYISSEGSHLIFVIMDDEDRVSFIQDLHDYAVKGKTDVPLLDWVGYTPPKEVADLVQIVKKPADLTPDLYKQIMRVLAVS